MTLTLVTTWVGGYNRGSLDHGIHCNMMKIVNITTAAFLLFLSNSIWAAPKPIPDPPALEADSYFLMDFDSGQVIAEKNADKRVEPASITKLMTAYVIFNEMLI